MTAPVDRSETLKKWVEPEVRTLEVRDTAAFPTLGGDGSLKYADSTRS